MKRYRPDIPRLLDVLAALSPIATVPILGTVYYLLEPKFGHDSFAAPFLGGILISIVPALLYNWRMQAYLAKTWRRNMAVCGLLVGYWVAVVVLLDYTDPGSNAMINAPIAFVVFAVAVFFHKTEIDIYHHDGTFSLGGRKTTLQDPTSSETDVSNRQSGQIVSN